MSKIKAKKAYTLKMPAKNILIVKDNKRKKKKRGIE
jgi:hypothetical protein